MPLNAANKEVITIATGETRKYMFLNGAKVPCNALIINQSAVAMGVQFQNAKPTNAIQTVSVTSGSAGTFKLSFNGQTTAAIAYNASAATVKAALEALSTMQNLKFNGSYRSADLKVDLTSAVYTIEFHGALAGQKVPLLVVADDSVTGATVAVAETQAGADVPPDSAFTDVDPDGYSAALSVAALGQLPVSFGSYAASGAASRLLGPFFRVVVTGAGAWGMIELATAGDNVSLIRI